MGLLLVVWYHVTYDHMERAMQGIAEWLASIGLAEYVERFAENAVDLAVLPERAGLEGSRGEARASPQAAARNRRARPCSPCTGHAIAEKTAAESVAAARGRATPLASV
jgi:hypothetical protein